MNSYQKAVEALKECVKDAVDSNINASTQSEIWRHYQGMKAIAKMFPEQKTEYTEYSFSLSENGNIDITSSPYYNPDYNIGIPSGVAAADTISFGNAYGNDVITFS